MGKDYDIGIDIKPDINIGTGYSTKSDYGGDLSGDTGTNLNGGDMNKLLKDYSYDDYLESGDVSNPLEVNTDTDLNEYNSGYTNDEIRNSLDSSYGEDLNKYSKDTDSEQMDAALENFREDKWSDLSLYEQKQSMTRFADYVADVTGNKNPPEIVFRDDMDEGAYGGYSPDTNTLEINENMLGDSAEAADTVAHEMWHAYQQQCALDPTSEKGQEYQDGFDNYISPEYDFEGYQNQMVESEAREFAQGFKDRLAGLRGA
jgi:hypothetical protein